MYECSKDDCSCMVDHQFTYCSEECEAGEPCGHGGCYCGSENT